MEAKWWHFPEARLYIFRGVGFIVAIGSWVRQPDAHQETRIGMPESCGELGGPHGCQTVTLMPALERPVNPVAPAPGTALGATCCQVCCMAEKACCAADRLPDCKA